MKKLILLFTVFLLVSSCSNNVETAQEPVIEQKTIEDYDFSEFNWNMEMTENGYFHFVGTTDNGVVAIMTFDGENYHVEIKENGKTVCTSDMQIKGDFANGSYKIY